MKHSKTNNTLFPQRNRLKLKTDPTDFLSSPISRHTKGSLSSGTFDKIAKRDCHSKLQSKRSNYNISIRSNSKARNSITQIAQKLCTNLHFSQKENRSIVDPGSRRCSKACHDCKKEIEHLKMIIRNLEKRNTELQQEVKFYKTKCLKKPKTCKIYDEKSNSGSTSQLDAIKEPEDPIPTRPRKKRVNLKKLQSIDRKEESVPSDAEEEDQNSAKRFPKSVHNVKMLLSKGQALRTVVNLSHSRNIDVEKPLRNSRILSLIGQSFQERREQHKRAKSIKECDLASNFSKEIDENGGVNLILSSLVSPRLSLNTKTIKCIKG
ncbi:unnamed protein product [Moneuplotes crassus]|uniref:Uncharacterized protein n=1 Tax=Euplotes crassus TaxID=5936 RepID=A0AAD1U806_EUPCR|nr:unnamed protein product [Moneuplotes crassus]